MTVSQLRKKCADMALSYVGAKESDGSHKPIIDIYNQIKPLPRGYKMKYTDPWCAAFVSVVSANCGFLSIMPAECGCGPMIDLYKKMGRWEENDAYNAEIGDVVFYDWQDSGIGDNVGSADHVGIIVEVTKTGFVVVEGNMSDAVGTRNLLKNGKYIRGFGCPAYEVLSDENPEIPVEDNDDEIIIEPSEPRKRITIEVEELSYGDGLNNPDPMVESAQILLIEKKFPCGSAGHDGEFGPGTLAGVKNYQEAKGLKVTGKVDAETWMNLIWKK